LRNVAVHDEQFGQAGGRDFGYVKTVISAGLHITAPPCRTLRPEGGYGGARLSVIAATGCGTICRLADTQACGLHRRLPGRPLIQPSPSMMPQAHATGLLEDWD